MARIGVLFPVYNAELFLKPAIESVLCQTFGDFRLYIIDDGSTDNSRAIIESIKDDRIVYIRKAENRGITETLNLGLETAQEELLVRMDADDLSLPHRFEKQRAFMDAHPEVMICGSQVEYFGDTTGVSSYPVTHEEIAATLLFENPLAHPTVMMRRSFIVENNLRYEKAFRHLEDYGLWLRSVRIGRMANLNTCLLRYRVAGQNISLSNLHTRAERMNAIFDIFPPETELGDPVNRNLHLELCGLKPVEKIENVIRYSRAFENRIKKSNFFDRSAVERVVAYYRNLLFYKQADLSVKAAFLFWKASGRLKWAEMRYLAAGRLRSGKRNA